MKPISIIFTIILCLNTLDFLANKDPLISISSSVGNLGISNQVFYSSEGIGSLRSVENHSMLGYRFSAAIQKKVKNNFWIGPGLSFLSHRNILSFEYQFPNSPNDYIYKDFEKVFWTKRFGIDLSLRYIIKKVHLSSSLGVFRTLKQNSNFSSSDYTVWLFNNDEQSITNFHDSYYRRDNSFSEVYIYNGLEYELLKNLNIGVIFGVTNLKKRFGSKLYQFKQDFLYTHDPPSVEKRIGITELQFFEPKYSISLSINYQIQFN